MNTDKIRFIKLIKDGIDLKNDENNNLEEFFDFIDELEKKSKDRESQLLLTDCYLKIKNKKQALKVFQTIYNPKNKKDVLKMHEIQNLTDECVIRPSERSNNIPDFHYASKGVVSRLFCEIPSVNCEICNKDNVPFYYGSAYDEYSRRILFQNIDKHYCLECMKNGKISEKLHLTFQNPYIMENKGISDINNKIISEMTPNCDEEFGILIETDWPICCNDYMFYENEDNTNFYFICKTCNKEVKIKRD